MIPHIWLLSLVVMFPFSVAVLVRIRRIGQSYPTDYLYPFFLCSLATVFTFYSNILPMYIQINMPHLWHGLPFAIHHFWVLFGMLSSMLSILFLIRTVKSLMQYKRVHWTEYILFLFLSIFFVQWLIHFLMPTSPLINWMRRINRLIPLRYLGVLIVAALIVLFHHAYRRKTEPMSLPMRAFSRFFLLREGLDLSAFIFYDTLLRRIDSLESRFSLFLLKDLTYIFLTILLTFIWLEHHLLPVLRSADTMDDLDNRLTALAALRGMTPREKEIALLIVTGKSNKEIGVTLDLSANTVKNHAYRLYQKLGINSRFELIDMIKSHSLG